MRRFFFAALIAGLASLVVADAAQAQRGNRGGWSGYPGGVTTPGGFSINFGQPNYGYWGPSNYGYSNFGYGRYNNPGYGNWNYVNPSYGRWNSQPYYGNNFYPRTYYPSSTLTYSSEPVMRQSAYLAPELSSNQATMRVQVPNPNARVWFEDHLTQQTGTERIFQSPALEPGKSYTYTVKASWVDENGQELTKQKTVQVAAGQESVVNFRE